MNFSNAQVKVLHQWDEITKLEDDVKFLKGKNAYLESQDRRAQSKVLH
jgi:hypothetical protein